MLGTKVLKQTILFVILAQESKGPGAMITKLMKLLPLYRNRIMTGIFVITRVQNPWL